MPSRGPEASDPRPGRRDGAFRFNHAVSRATVGDKCDVSANLKFTDAQPCNASALTHIFSMSCMRPARASWACAFLCDACGPRLSAGFARAQALGCRHISREIAPGRGLD
jgi:hypothetical protein